MNFSRYQSPKKSSTIIESVTSDFLSKEIILKKYLNHILNVKIHAEVIFGRSLYKLETIIIIQG